MDNFITWEMFNVFATLGAVVFMVVEFIKELGPLAVFKTKYLSWIVAFLLILLSNIVLGTFVFVDVFLYALSAIAVSLSANGLYDFNKTVIDKKDM